jgi:hypothetical protein
MADVPDRLLPASQPAASGAARADLPKPLSHSLLIPSFVALKDWD